MRGSASASTARPLTVSLMCILSDIVPPPGQAARSLARWIARRTMTPARWVRKSAGPRSSAAGWVMAVRVRHRLGDRGVVDRGADQRLRRHRLAKSGVPATLVSAIAAALQRPRDRVRMTAAAAVA